MRLFSVFIAHFTPSLVSTAVKTDICIVES